MNSLPIFNTSDRPFAQMQTQWSAALTPLLQLPLTQGTTLKNISLSIGDNVINHMLQRSIQGYLITNMQGAFSQIYSKPSTMPDLTMILNSSAATIVTIYVF